MEGCDFVEANTTPQAKQLLSVHRIDLVLIDERTPEGDTEEFCREVRNITSRSFTTIFVCSNDLESQAALVKAGADEVFLKPVRDEVLRTRVWAALIYSSMVNSLEETERVLFSLANAIEERDPDMGHHCKRLSLTSGAVGIALGLEPSDVLTLQRASYYTISARLEFRTGFYLRLAR
jgi:putative two-component system response regulator